jgi:hypothetical protein
MGSAEAADRARRAVWWGTRPAEGASGGGREREGGFGVAARENLVDSVWEAGGEERGFLATL